MSLTMVMASMVCCVHGVSSVAGRELAQDAATRPPEVCDGEEGSRDVETEASPRVPGRIRDVHGQIWRVNKSLKRVRRHQRKSCTHGGHHRSHVVGGRSVPELRKGGQTAEETERRRRSEGRIAAVCRDRKMVCRKCQSDQHLNHLVHRIQLTGFISLIQRLDGFVVDRRHLVAREMQLQTSKLAGRRVGGKRICSK